MRTSIGVLCALPLLAAAAQPQFRSETDVVRLDVLVEDDGRPVTGLTAADFAVRDNDVIQRVALLRDSVPLSIDVVLDVSGSITSEQMADAARAVGALRRSLADGDRLHAYAFAADVRAIALEPAGAGPVGLQELAHALRRAAGAQTAFLDGVQTAVLNGPANDASRLLVSVTDGRDNASSVDARTVIDTALRRGVSLSFVALPSTVRTGRPGVPPVVSDTGLRLLHLLAGRTGGRVVNMSRSRPLGPVFEAVLREYRQRYILSFEPTGVGKGDGWHRVHVALKGRRARIHVRDGYWSP